MTMPSTGSTDAVLYFGPLDGARLQVPLLSNGRPPELHAFPCPGGRGDMLYRRSEQPASSGALRYEWTGERDTGVSAT
jgi:hypothetical protein